MLSMFIFGAGLVGFAGGSFCLGAWYFGKVEFFGCYETFKLELSDVVDSDFLSKKLFSEMMVLNFYVVAFPLAAIVSFTS